MRANFPVKMPMAGYRQLLDPPTGYKADTVINIDNNMGLFIYALINILGLRGMEYLTMRTDISRY